MKTMTHISAEDDPARRGRVEHAVDDDTMEVKVRVKRPLESPDTISQLS
jgi:hypothetical protein